MLREAKSADFVQTGAWLRRRWVFHAGRHIAARGLTAAELDAATAAQERTAVPVLDAEARRYWWCRGRFWWEDEGLAAEDVFALAFEREQRTARRLERAHAVVAAEALPERPRRAPIPQDVRRAVFDRDGGCCVECGATFDLQYDHVIPVALGGASTAENLQLLCAPCNQRKGAAL